MKNLIFIFLFLLAVGLTLIATKPTNEKCIELVKNRIRKSVKFDSGQGIVNILYHTIVNTDFQSIKGIVRVEDRTFYKEVYVINRQAGAVIFGIFIPVG